MYQSAGWGDRRLNPTELKELGVEACLGKLIEFMNKWKYSDEWRDIIIYILKNREEPQQFQMLRVMCEEMNKTNKATLVSALDYCDDNMVHCRSLGSFYLLLSYFYADGNKPRYYFTIKRIYNSLVDKFGLYEKEIAKLEDLSQQEYPQRLVEHVRVVVDTMPKFFTDIHEKLNTASVDLLLGWILIYPQKTREEIINLNKFCKFIVSSVSDPDPYTQQFNRDASAALLLSIIRKCDLNYPGTDNLYLLIDHLPDISINSIDESRDLCSLTSKTFVNCFARMTKSTVTVRIVKLLQTLSFALRRDSDFFTLNRLYKEIILPRIIRFHKSSTVCQSQLKKLAKYYVEGFLGIVPITKDELGYFFHNYTLVKRKDMEHWIKLACIASHGNRNLTNDLSRLAANIITTPAVTIITEKEYAHALDNAWQIDGKDLQERKKYALIESRMSGIVNPNSRCYIISVMQMLYMTKSVPEMLKAFEKEYAQKGYISMSKIKCKLLYELRWLMEDLKDLRKSIHVDKIKDDGPEDFRISEGQQDCHEYILALFNSMQAQFNAMSPTAKQDIIAHFKRIFEITIKTTIKCEKCGTTSEKNEESFLHSINLKEDLTEEWVTTITHTCDKCKASSPNRQMRKKIIHWPEVLLVHLERYSFKNDKQTKELGWSNIPRKFKQYKLMGFICHIGKNPLCGHYVLYWRKQDKPLTWLEFNDERVYEFQLEKEDEPFERNFRSANTPYILIYQQISRQ